MEEKGERYGGGNLGGFGHVVARNTVKNVLPWVKIIFVVFEKADERNIISVRHTPVNKK
jgi:hypothetical protein